MNIQRLDVIIGKNQTGIAGELNLRDGQKIVGRILNVENDQVLLEMAGHILPAKVEGLSVSAGSLFLFKVSLAKENQIELKVISNLQGETNPTNVSKDIQVQSSPEYRLYQALSEMGVKPLPENLAKMIRVMAEYQTKYQQVPELKAFALLFAQKWPVTPGTTMLAWMSQDPEVRSYLWNLLQDSGLLEKYLIIKPSNNRNQIIRALQQIQNQPESNGESPLLKEVSSNQSDLSLKIQQENEKLLLAENSERKLVDSFSEKSLESIREVLQKSFQLSSNWSRSSDRPVVGGFYPFLVPDSQGKLHECFIEWQEEQNLKEKNQKEQLIRVQLFTDNLGEILLQVRIKPNHTLVDIRVESDPIRQILQEKKVELINTIDISATVTISLREKVTQPISGKVDLWM